jgi:hypothetical protein
MSATGETDIDSDAAEGSDVDELEVMLAVSEVISPEGFAGAVQHQVEDRLGGRFGPAGLPVGSTVEFIPRVIEEQVDGKAIRNGTGRLSLVMGSNGELAFSIFQNYAGENVHTSGKIVRSGPDSFSISDYKEATPGRAEGHIRGSVLMESQTKRKLPQLVGEKEIEVMKKLSGFLGSDQHKVRLSTGE